MELYSYALSLEDLSDNLSLREKFYGLLGEPFLKFFMLNCFSMVSIYMDWDNPSNLFDLSV